MALDESKDTDFEHKVNGFLFVVDKDLMEQAKPIKVDFTPLGFKVDSSMRFDGCGGSCGTSCG